MALRPDLREQRRLQEPERPARATEEPLASARGDEAVLQPLPWPDGRRNAPRADCVP